MVWALKLETRPKGGESGGPILEFEIYSASKTWSLGPGQNTMALPVQKVSVFRFQFFVFFPDT
jgi:hypothetical protein